MGLDHVEIAHTPRMESRTQVLLHRQEGGLLYTCFVGNRNAPDGNGVCKATGLSVLHPTNSDPVSAHSPRSCLIGSE